jgi:cytidylate kinase
MARIIAIDGPSGSGKGTVSALVAKRLKYQYLDTGALYRALALRLVRMGRRAEDPEEVIHQAIRGATVSFDGDRVFLDGDDVSAEIRTPEAGHYASVFSARKSVRDYLLEIQRAAGRRDDIVVEGRDMTTVVFPDAGVKIFLDASVGERARRRYLQLKARGIPVTMEDAVRDVRDRDFRDSNRELAPLKRADDALLIDTTGMTIEEVVERIVSEAEKVYP